MSSFTHLPRLPLHVQQNLQKALSGGSAEEELSNYKQNAPEEVPAYPAGVVPTFRAAPDRVNGNAVFRRFPDGSLDIAYAANKVIDMVHRVQESDNSGAFLTNQEELTLSVVFPRVFAYVDVSLLDRMREVNLRITADEAVLIAMRVSSHLKEEMNWSAGNGGGSVEGRSTTRA